MDTSIVKSEVLCGQNEIYIHYTSGFKDLNLTPLHAHDHYEIMLMCDGELEHLINGAKTTLKKRTIVFLRPEDTHKLSDMGTPFRYLNITLTNSIMNDLFVFPINEYYRKLLDDPLMPPSFSLSHSEFDKISNSLAAIHTASSSHPETKKAEIRMTIANIFWDCFREADLLGDINRENEETTAVPQWLWKFHKELQKPEVFTRDSKYILSLADRTRESLSRAYSKYYNTTLKETILELRTNYACNLLQYTNKEIIEIAMDCGFENLSTFYHVFVKKTNYTPKAYRNMNIPSTEDVLESDKGTSTQL